MFKTICSGLFRIICFTLQISSLLSSNMHKSYLERKALSLLIVLIFNVGFPHIYCLHSLPNLFESMICSQLSISLSSKYTSHFWTEIQGSSVFIATNLQGSINLILENLSFICLFGITLSWFPSLAILSSTLKQGDNTKFYLCVWFLISHFLPHRDLIYSILPISVGLPLSLINVTPEFLLQSSLLSPTFYSGPAIQSRETSLCSR